MEKLIRNRKGFSMVELLVALLIMAVIIAAALTMMGGVLQSGKVKADQDAAETISKAISNYVNTTNDTDLSMLGVTSGTTTSDVLIKTLCAQMVIDKTAKTVTLKGYAPATNDFSAGATGLLTPVTTNIPAAAPDGTIGPFLDGSKPVDPQENNVKGWSISFNKDAGKAIVKVEATAANAVVTIK